MGSLGRFSDASGILHSAWRVGDYSPTFTGEWYSTVWMYNDLPTHPPLHGRLDCFQFVAIVSKPAISFHRQLYMDICFRFP